MAGVDQLLADTLSTNSDTRKQAENTLWESAKQPNFLLSLLRLIDTRKNGDGVTQSAAVFFKNAVKAAWDTAKDEEDRKGIFISVADRTTIKQNLVELMCTSSPLIQAQISEAISIIATSDYPNQWETLLPKLVEQMKSPDINIVNGVLITADTIFKSFRHVMKSDGLYSVIIYTLNGIQEPLLELLEQVTQAVLAAANSKVDLEPRMETLRLIVSIYHSLSYQDLPEHFEDNIGAWMKGFELYLQYTNPLLVDNDEEDQPGPIDKLQTEIVNVLKLFLERDEEIWSDNYIDTFTGLVWKLVMGTTHFAKHDQLVVTSMKYLSLLVGRPLYARLFQSDDSLQQIVTSIVIPNLMVRESDEILFDENPKDFIMTELEGSDSESRRRCSQDLLKAMCRQFESRTTAICSEHVTTLISEFTANPANKWQLKDTAIALMMGITIRKESSFGVSEINQNVGLMTFFTSQILPELQDPDHNSRPMVKATSLNFVCTFRNQFSSAQLVELLPFLISSLGSDFVVVQSLAANAIEELERCKEKGPNGLLQYKLARQDLEKMLQNLFTALFRIIDNIALNENPYAMKCVMRTLDRAGDAVIPVTPIVFERLSAALQHVCRNPRDPGFNHNLFESIAILVKSVCKDPSRIVDMENMLFPPFQTILQADIVEFTPYAFQILGQLLEYRPQEAGLGTAFESLFPPLLTASLWEKNGNVPGLVRLLQSYLKHIGPQLAQAGHLTPMLGIWQKLNSAKVTESNAFELLSALTKYVPQSDMNVMLKTVFLVVLTRLRSTKSNLYPIRAVQYFALFCGLYGGQSFAGYLNEIQPNLHLQIAGMVWAPKALGASSSRILAKSQVIGLSKYMFDVPLLNDDPGKQVFGQCVLAIVSILLSSSFSKEVKDISDEGAMVYDATFSSLKYAIKVPEDPFPSIADPASAFVIGLKTISEQYPGVMTPLLRPLAEDEKIATGFQSLLQSHQVNLA